MGLRDWYIRKELKPYIEDAVKLAATEEAKAEKEKREMDEQHDTTDTDKAKVALHGLVAAALVGVGGILGDTLQHMEFSKAGLYRALGAIAAAALAAGGAYMHGLVTATPTK